MHWMMEWIAGTWVVRTIWDWHIHRKVERKLRASMTHTADDAGVTLALQERIEWHKLNPEMERVIPLRSGNKIVQERTVWLLVRVIEAYARRHRRRCGGTFEEAVVTVLEDFTNVLGDERLGLRMLLLMEARGLHFQDRRDAIAWLTMLRGRAEIMTTQDVRELAMVRRRLFKEMRKLIRRVKPGSKDVLVEAASYHLRQQAPGRFRKETADKAARMIMSQLQPDDKRVRRSGLLGAVDSCVQDYQNLDVGVPGLDLLMLVAEAGIRSDRHRDQVGWVRRVCVELQVYLEEVHGDQKNLPREVRRVMKGLASLSQDHVEVFQLAPNNVRLALMIRYTGSRLSLPRSLRLVAYAIRNFHVEQLARWVRRGDPRRLPGLLTQYESHATQYDAADLFANMGRPIKQESHVH